ncbi:peptidoglycan-binding protein [Rhizobium sp. TH2]|uniref:peptidoglycan-binding protein n=1 Tax=Rhizobium sp. TH2 TaxID=2775403 RepID=UPI002157B448|nr:peptidoglycan-binding protein [Rhizobium sp. TH2]
MIGAGDSNAGSFRQGVERAADMNGSRSNTPNGGKSSLDQLNRTIEGLEARIQGLMGEKNQMKPSGRSPVDEILERQRSLGSTRERVSAVMERGRPEPQRYEAPVYEQPQRMNEPAWDRPAPRVAAPDPAIGEIAATLAALREELHRELGDGLQGSLSELKNEMRSLTAAAATAPQGGVEDLHDDLMVLAQSLDKLEGASRNMDTRPLRADLDELRAMLGGVAREDSVRGLEARFANTEKAISGFSPDALKEELVQLAWRIDGIKSGLGEMSAAPAVKALEDKLLAVANAVEMLGRKMQGQNAIAQQHTAIAEQFSGLDQRLDEITRAIAASARPSGSVLDGAALQRLENRIEDLVDHIGAMQTANPADEVAARIEALTARIEEMATEEATRKLEDRLGQLSSLIERNFREGAAPAAFTGHLEDISRKIDGLGGGNADALIDRLEMLSRKIDEIELPATVAAVASTESAAMTRLESRLADIAARLDESAAAPATDEGALKSLEKQIANLSGLLNQPGTAMPVASGLPEDFGTRMNAIEDYIASSDEFIVEAARQAAETVVEAYSRNGFAAQQGVSASEMQALSGLAEDLRTLESHSRSSEERTQATFEALHETLVQIAGRLNDLGTPAPTERYVERAAPVQEPVRESRERLMETVAMPKAPQPEFANVDLLADEPQLRRAPENSKVAVFDEEEMMPAEEAASDDLVAANPTPMTAKAEPRASKSLIAGLAAKLKPGKKDKTKDAARVSIEPAPALDPGEAVVTAEPNMLLEPGSGVPDVKKILEKVRNGQQNGKRDAAMPGSSSDVIAAARRAAQAAAAEAGAQKFAQPTAFKKEKQPSKSMFGGMGSNRRPILLAAAAVLLVVMSYPLVSNLIGNRDAAVVAPEVAQERAIDIPAETTNAATTDTPVVNDAAAPVEAEKPVDDAAAPVDTTPVEETASDKMMAPVESTDSASVLEKPADATPEAVTAEAPRDAAVPAETTDTTPVAEEQKAADQAAEVPADKQASAKTEVGVPAGLTPASLAEAVKKGDPLAYFEIGARYTDGRGGVKVNLAEASKWYALAADKGNAPAEYRLANFYEKGTGVTRDIAKAQTLYTAAADKGNASAMHNLAVLYATGVGGTPDFAQAAHWFTEAADLNVRDSQFNLAILYARGNGVPQDLTESYKWFAIAAREGDQDAAQKRDEVANALSPEQLKSAKAKLDLWKPKAMNDAANTPMVPDEWLAKGKTTATVDMKRAIRNIQAILNNNGFDAGKPDGEMGKKTVTAIKAFQKSVGQEPSGRIDDALVKELLKRNKVKS